MANILEMCGTGGCPKERECAKKLDTNELNVRVSKFSYDVIGKRFNCVGFQKVFRPPS
jgi:hypothetical protein